jgi:hypothetical protein
MMVAPRLQLAGAGLGIGPRLAAWAQAGIQFLEARRSRERGLQGWPKPGLPWPSRSSDPVFHSH